MCLLSSFDETADLQEIALCAALSPEFRDRLLQAFFGIQPESPAPVQPTAARQQAQPLAANGT
jgi:hypothetical protein